MEQNTNVCTLYYSTEYYTIQKTKPLAWLSTLDPSGHFDYSYACIYQLNIEDFVVEINHGDILYFPFCLNSAKQQKLAFTQYTVLCAKTLIMACAYVGFFPVFITNLFI